MTRHEYSPCVDSIDINDVPTPPLKNGTFSEKISRMFKGSSSGWLGGSTITVCIELPAEGFFFKKMTDWADHEVGPINFETETLDRSVPVRIKYLERTLRIDER